MCAALLVVLLPALVAGRHVDAPVTAAERERLEQALADPDGTATGPANAVYLTFVDEASLRAAGPDERPALLDRQVAVARVGMLLSLFVACALFHLAVVLALGRGVAWLACLLFAFSPSVVTAGHVLRPEPINLAFAMLGMSALVGIGVVPGRRRSETLSSFALFAATVVAGVSLGVAVAIQPAYGLHLFWPALGLLHVLVGNVQAYVRAVKLDRPDEVSALALTLALVPWLGAALLALVSASFLLSEQAPGPTLTGAGLAPGWLLPLMLVLAVFGALVWTAGIGAVPAAQRVGHWLLLGYAVAMITHRLALVPGADALPAAPALALLVTMGGRMVWTLWGRRRARVAATAAAA